MMNFMINVISLSEMTEDRRPIRSKFDRQVQRVQEDVLRMGALVENSFWLAHQAMFERNLAAAEAIAKQDKQIDKLYRQIEEDCISLIALQSPVARDLRLLSTIMQLIRDLERIGDYAKDIGNIAIKLFPYPLPACIQQIQAMSLHCQEMVSMSLAALTELDADAGVQLQDIDDVVDNDYELLYEELAHRTECTGTIEPILLLVLVIRHLERMADHATNIGLRVGYIVTGERQ
jgi:phosphate transport system protein